MAILKGNKVLTCHEVKLVGEVEEPERDDRGDRRVLPALVGLAAIPNGKVLQDLVFNERFHQDSAENEK